MAILVIANLWVEIESSLVLLLCGGDKKSQQGDIEIAKTYWREYKETHQ